MSLVERVRSTVARAMGRLAEAGELGPEGKSLEAMPWSVERPKRPEHGDLATNVAMVVTKRAGKSPRAIAEALVKALEGDAVVRAAEIAGPGFLNLRLHSAAFHAELGEILGAGKAYGRAPAATGERIDVEFVSANPTGPVTVASGRNAALGDAIARLLEATGNRVTREYYINDRGSQVLKLAESVRASAAGRPAPEDGYRGAYVSELASAIARVDPGLLAGDDDALARACVTWMLRGVPGSRTLPGIRPSLASMGVVFDVWFSEESLHRWGAVRAALKQLEEGGYLERKEGALFFKAPPKSAGAGAGGALEDKDRVVEKSDGTYAYFASDIAYFSDKIGRGYDRLVYVLGADHHGTVPRLRNALVALGFDPSRFEPLLYQLVFVTKGGETVKSSKRAGNIVTIDEVMDEIDEAAGRKGAGADALRFFFLSRSANSNVEFDIELAKKKSLDNPVFYVQYGHARLCSIRRKAESIGLAASRGGAPILTLAEWAPLVHPDELAMASRLAEFPATLAEAAKDREPHRIAFYVQELAREFQSYFTRLKNEKDPILPPAGVRGAPGWEKEWDFPKTRARLAWIEAVRTVYAAGLGLLGVSAPDRMDRPAEAASSAAAAGPDEDE